MLKAKRFYSDPPGNMNWIELFRFFWLQGVGNVVDAEGLPTSWSANTLADRMEEIGRPISTRAIHAWRSGNSKPKRNVKNLAEVAANGVFERRLAWTRAFNTAMSRQAAPNRTAFRGGVVAQNLPTPLNPIFVGRKTELDHLVEATSKRSLKAIEIIAAGGAGKSTLVHHLIGELREANQRVFGWSFYNQAADHHPESSSSTMLMALFRYFGHLLNKIEDPFEIGQTAANWAAENGVLIILDGLEVLQYSDGSMFGTVKIRSIKSLLSGLLNNKGGMIVTTSRLPVAELTQFPENYRFTMSLGPLSDESGVELLRQRGVLSPNKRTEQEELERDVHDFMGHPLSLNLLASYVCLKFSGDILGRYGDANLFSRQSREVKFASDILISYTILLQANELEVLQFLQCVGLIDGSINYEPI